MLGSYGSFTGQKWTKIEERVVRRTLIWKRRFVIGLAHLNAKCHAGVPYRGGVILCTTPVWRTVQIADGFSSIHHLHVQVQTMFDTPTSSFYCGQVTANAHPDLPSGQGGSLSVTLQTPSTLLHNTTRHVPFDCIALGNNDNSTCKCEGGGPGDSVTVPDVNVFAYASYRGSDGTNFPVTPVGDFCNQNIEESC